MGNCNDDVKKEGTQEGRGIMYKKLITRSAVTMGGMALMVYNIPAAADEHSLTVAIRFVLGLAMIGLVAWRVAHD